MNTIEETAQKLKTKVNTYNQKIDNSNSFNQLQNNVIQLQTLQGKRGDETRQKIQDVNDTVTAKNRYLELIERENNEWNITLHAIISFFTVATFAVIPVVAYLSGRLSLAYTWTIVICLFVLYCIYLIYQVQRSGVKDFIEPTATTGKNTFGNLERFLRSQMNIGDDALVGYVNENCSCPSDSTSNTNQSLSSNNGTTNSNQPITFYMPSGFVYSDGTAPHQIPGTKISKQDKYVFSIEWEDAWNYSNILLDSITSEQASRVLTIVDIPTSSANNRCAKELTKVATICSPKLPLVTYVQLVLLYIYRDRRVVSATDIVNGVKLFRTNGWSYDINGGCNFINSVFNSVSFTVTFGDRFKWFNYVCKHPFLVLPSNESLTKRL